MLWKRRRADSHLFGPTAQRELGTRAAAGPDRGAHAHGSFAEMDPHYYIIGLHCLALFLETQLLHGVFGNILSLQWGSPQHARMARSCRPSRARVDPPRGSITLLDKNGCAGRQLETQRNAAVSRPRRQLKQYGARRRRGYFDEQER